MIRSFLAKRRVKKLLMVIPGTLAKDYGQSDEYTSGQVKTAAKKLGYKDGEIIKIAIAIFCNKEAAEAFGMDKDLIKKYKGYSKQHRVNVDVAAGAGLAIYIVKIRNKKTTLLYEDNKVA